MSAVGLGSCVALILYDRATQVAGMAHILLPHEALSRSPGGPAKFSNTAVAHLLEQMATLADLQAPVATLVGGASMFASLLRTGGINMGERNIAATRQALAGAGIAVAGEDVGGEYGRSVYFDVATGVVRVVSIQHGERVV
ncbi:MAG: chemotaxis protein CheD [Gemmatimonadaceae bacterium]